MSVETNVITTTPPGPRFPIRDVRIDLIDRLTPSVEDDELLSLKLDENEIVILNAEDICKRFPNLEKVSVNYNSIKQIDMFPWFTNLRELHLKGNLLTVESVNAKSWKACSRTLEVLDLSNNKYSIHIVSHLKVLKALRTLSLKGNPCEFYKGIISDAKDDDDDDDYDEDDTYNDENDDFHSNFGDEEEENYGDRPKNYRDFVSEAISGLLLLDGFKTFRGLKPQSFLNNSPSNNNENGIRNIGLPTSSMYNSNNNNNNKQESKQELPHRDIVNQAFANAKSEATASERVHFERQVKTMQDDFDKTLQRQKESYELEYKQRIKKEIMEACAKIQDEMNHEFKRKQKIEIDNLNARHQLEMDTALQTHEMERNNAIREAVTKNIEEKCAEMEEEHLLEKSRMKQAMTDNFDAKIKHIQERHQIEITEKIAIAVKTAVEATEESLNRSHNSKMKEIVDELTSSFQSKERQIIRDERAKYDQDINMAVNNAIEKIVIEKEALKLEIKNLKKQINSLEEQFASQELILGWGKAFEVIVEKDNGNKSNSSDDENKQKNNVTRKQTAAGYTRLLTSWRQKVFELLIHGNNSNNFNGSRLKNNDNSSGRSSSSSSNGDILQKTQQREEQQMIPILEAKLQHARLELNKLQEQENNKIRMEEQIKYLSKSLEDVKINMEKKEKELESFRTEIIKYKTMENEHTMLKDLSVKNEIEYKKMIANYDDLFNKTKIAEKLLFNKDNQINKLNHDISKLNASLAEYKTVSSDIGKMQTIINEKGREIVLLQDEIVKLKQLRKEDIQIQEASKAEYTVNKLYSGKLVNELDETKEEINALKVLKEEHIRLIENLRTESDSSKKEAEKFKALIYDARKECAYLIAHVLEPIIETFAEKCRQYTSTDDVIRGVYTELTDEQIIQLKKIDEDNVELSTNRT